jgi:DNA-directed RNA polymerase subunit RPC12/RpoP
VPEFLGTAVAEVNLRPRRIAYLIESGSGEQLGKAIAYASTEWGGVTQLIVPVNKRGTISRYWRDVCDVISPECFIDYAGLPDSLATELRNAYNASIHPESLLSHSEPGIHALASLPPGSLQLEAFVSREESLLVSGILGVVPKEHMSLWEEVGVSFVHAESAMDLLNAQINGLSPIEVTRRNIEIFEVQSGTPGGIIVLPIGRVTPQQVLHFWNLRALSYPSFGTYLLCLPRSALQEEEVAERLRDLCVERSRMVPDLVLYGHQPVLLQQLGERMGFQLPLDKKVSWTFAAEEKRDLAKRPLTCRVNIPPEVFLGGVRFFGQRIKVPVSILAGNVTLHAESPVRFHPRIRGFLRWEVRGVPHLRWPPSPSVARLIHQNASFSQFGVGVITGPNTEYGFPLSIPEPESVCSAYLKDHGMTWSPSDKGRYAHALSESIGADVVRELLGNSQRMAVISELVSISRKKAEQLLDRVHIVSGSADEIAGILESTASPRWRGLDELAGATNNPKQAVALIAAELVSAGLLRRAFAYRCPRCGLRTAVLLSEAKDTVRCAGCRFHSILVGPNGQEPRMLYALNSLLDRAMDQDCVDHILAGEYLRSSYMVSWYVPGADLTDQSGDAHEVDILGLSETGVILGEIKKRVAAITKKELRKILSLAAGVPRAKAVVASSDDWSAEQSETALDLARSVGVDLTILGPPELFSES